MSGSGYSNPFKLGRPRNEISFTAGLEEAETLTVRNAAYDHFNRNVSGESFRNTLRSRDVSWILKFSKISDGLRLKLESLLHVADEPLGFLAFDSWPVWSDRYVLETADTLILKSNPMTLAGAAYKAAGGTNTDIIGISGVFAGYDPAGAQMTTNYFTTGGGLAGYDATSRRVTLKSSPGAAGTEVFVNWTYKGALVWLKPFQATHVGGFVTAAGPLWDATLELAGV